MSNITLYSNPHWQALLTAPFMTHALIAGALISIAAGLVGYFTIARNTTFSAHAMAHIGLPGATGAALIGAPVEAGLGLFALGGAMAIAALGKKAGHRETVTGTILAFALGLGLFFARLSAAASEQLQSTLFGSILTVTATQLWEMAIFDVILAIVMAVIYNPLLFSSVDDEVARAKGVPVQRLNYIFMAMLAGTVTISVRAVGTLLIFALLVTPAAAANILARRPRSAMLLTGIICFVSIVGGLIINAMVPAPPSFIIVTISTIIWLAAELVARIRK